MRRLLITITLLFSCWFAVLPITTAQSQTQPVIHAVLFYSTSCGHCQYVVTEVLPPLFEQYGEQLVIVGVNVSESGGQVLFMSALQYFNLDQGGVPFLVVGDTYLVGSVDIPEKFPDLIEKYLAQGGVDWPAIPGLAEAMATAQPTEISPPIEATRTSAVTTIAASPTLVSPTLTPTPGLLMSDDLTGLGANFARDLLGNTLAVLVLTAMILSISGAVILFRHKPANGAGMATLASSRGWLILILCLIGLGVAGYLAYVETAQVDAVCGPVGDCNTVQQSEYARLFGFLPIGIFGVIGYVMILLAWAVGHFARKRLAAFASLALFVLAAFGVLFSIYLTFLEPFVIGATCAWCLTSAIIMTALFWLSVPPARQTLTYLGNRKKYIIRGKKHQRTL